MKAQIIIVDEHDNVIDLKDRASLNYDCDIYRVSALWVTNSRGEVLLAQRSLSKTHDPGKWGAAAAGTLEEKETYESNVIKEAEEELGLTGISPRAEHKDFIDGSYRFFCQWFSVVVDRPIDFFKKQDEEVAAITWWKLADLKSELLENPSRFLESMPETVEKIT